LYSPDSQRPSFQATFPPPSHCRLPALQSHRAARFLQPRRPPRADSGRWPLPRSVPPHQFGVKRRFRQPQRLLQADFVLQPRWCLSLADNALSLPLVTLHSLFLPREARVELNIVWQINDGRCPGLLSAYRRGGGGSSAPSLTSSSPSSAKMSNTKGREGRGPGAGLGSDRPGWPGHASTPTSESDHRRGKFGSRKGRIRAASPLGGGIKNGDHVRPTTSRGLNSGGWAARPVRGRAESGDKIK
jgi:hypothetical protein